MTPVTLEDHILAYYEQATGCSSLFVSPPPTECDSQVQTAYAFSKTHALTIILALFFVLAILQMIFATLFPAKGKH